jgi:hypothetical protein
MLLAAKPTGGKGTAGAVYFDGMIFDRDARRTRSDGQGCGVARHIGRSAACPARFAMKREGEHRSDHLRGWLRQGWSSRSGRGEAGWGGENTEKGSVKFKTHDKLKALDMLAKMARLYPADRSEITGVDGGPIQTANLNATVHKIDIEALEPEQREQLRGVLLALKAKQIEAEAPPDAS